MEILTKKGDILESRADLLVVGMYKGEEIENDFTTRLNELLAGKLEKMKKAQEFEGKIGQSLLLPTPDQVTADYVLVVGLGENDVRTLENLREVSGSVVQIAKKIGLRTIAMEFLGEDNEEFDAKASAEAISIGLLLSEYKYSKYKKKKGKSVKTVTIIAEDGRDARKAEKGVELAKVIVDGVVLSRDLVNAPGKDVLPLTLAAKAQEIAKNSKGKISCKVLNRVQCEKKKMNAYLAVAQGSASEPAFIHLTYKPEGRIKKTVALVGKGVTFDSGGLSLKPAQYMETMKCDMAGAAVVLGVFRTLAELNPKIEIHGIIAATENLISGNAIRPGDIVRASNGKTIEILNTDAEGRLTLADALVYAGKLNPDYTIDLATLTGACVVGLGEEIAAVMTNNDNFGKMVLDSAEEAGEKMWHMPLEERYRSLVESDVADLRNTAKSRYGGSLTAGLFLSEFVAEGMNWVHLDIAGPAFAEKPMASYIQKGGTGFGVRTLLNFIKNI